MHITCVVFTDGAVSVHITDQAPVVVSYEMIKKYFWGSPMHFCAEVHAELYELSQLSNYRPILLSEYLGNKFYPEQPKSRFQSLED